MTASIQSIEDEPLLSEDSSRESKSISRDRSVSLIANICRFASKQRGQAVPFVFALYFLSTFTWMFLDVPIVRLVEYAVCEKYYRAHPMQNLIVSGIIDERLCKKRPIQSEVAMLLGVRISLGAVVGTSYLVRISCVLITYYFCRAFECTVL